MGQLVTVLEKPSATPGVVRFETNRVLTGMDHEVYRSLDDIVDERPADVLARRLLERGGIELVSMNANVITVRLAQGAGSDGIADIIEDLYTYYRPGVEVVIPESPPEE